MRLVLDSNVWLDWLYFDDPAVAGLKQAGRNGELDIIIDPACRDELLRVLAYARFALDPTRQAAMMAEVDRVSRCLDTLRYRPAAELPWCSDPDDIKFLALAKAGNADWLISKDKALLGRPRQRRRQAIAWRIGTPQQWWSSQQAC
jgi:putative PIN family toxin of toxin-antitoxin system